MARAEAKVVALGPRIHSLSGTILGNVEHLEIGERLHGCGHLDTNDEGHAIEVLDNLAILEKLDIELLGNLGSPLLKAGNRSIGGVGKICRFLDHKRDAVVLGNAGSDIVLGAYANVRSVATRNARNGLCRYGNGAGRGFVATGSGNRDGAGLKRRHDAVFNRSDRRIAGGPAHGRIVCICRSHRCGELCGGVAYGKGKVRLVELNLLGGIGHAHRNGLGERPRGDDE